MLAPRSRTVPNAPAAACRWWSVLFPFRSATAPDVAAVLASLPPAYRVVPLADADVVLGPPGAFVVAAGNGNVQDIADRLVGRAVRLRAALAERMSWVPFIDALVVADHPGAHAVAATVVPADLLDQTLVQGTPMLSDESVTRLADLIEDLTAAEAADGTNGTDGFRYGAPGVPARQDSRSSSRRNGLY